jgi:oligosaccharide 4-alpha-D-glucosyltransferase
MNPETKVNVKRYILSIFLFACFVVPAAQATQYLSYTQKAGVVSLLTDQGTIDIKSLGPYAVEVYYPDVSNSLPSYAIAKTANVAAMQVTDAGNLLQIDNGYLSLVVHKAPLRIQFYREQTLLVEEHTGSYTGPEKIGLRFAMQPNEKLMGGGQRVLGMDRRGHKMPLYNRAHYGYTTESSQMYYSMPAVVSNRKYALIFDNGAKGNLDIGHTESDILQFDAVGGRLSYIVIAGKTYPDLLYQFTEVTGRQPLLPRWALGHFASRFGYRTQKQTEETVQALIDGGFPLDAVVLDLYWFGPDVKGHMGNLDWDLDAFPEPQSMIRKFKEKGVETVLITEPFVLTTSKNWQSAKQNHALAMDGKGQVKTYDFFFGHTGLIDVFSDAGQSWFAKVYERLAKQGVRGWWGDLGEPEVHPQDALHHINGQWLGADLVHNVYGHQWANLVDQVHRKVVPNERPVILMRAGFVGSQRFGMVPWTGDVSRSWDGLKPQVELSLQMSMLGLAYTHSDLGGFAGGEKFDPELYTRWMQYGVFQPIYRPHGQEDIAPEPVFHDKQTQDIVRRYIRLRYAMLPYNYTLMVQNSLTGMPLMRPMAFADEERDDYFDIKDQYFWGDSFLVKPVTQPNIAQVDMILPHGYWFDFWTDQVHRGGQTLKVATSLEHLPVMVKAGTFVPMAEAAQSTKAYQSDDLTVHYYHHPSQTHASYTLYDDDGNQPDSIALGEFQSIKFAADFSEHKQHIRINVQGDYSNSPSQRHIRLVLHNWNSAPQSIQFTKNLHFEDMDKIMTEESVDFIYDPVKKSLEIPITLQNAGFIKIFN